MGKDLAPEGMTRFTVVLQEQAGGGYTVQCVEIPGAISEGETVDEALANVRDAIAGVLEVRRAKARRAGAIERTVDVEA